MLFLSAIFGCWRKTSPDVGRTSSHIHKLYAIRACYAAIEGRFSEVIAVSMDADYAAHLDLVDIDGSSFLSERTSRSFFMHIRRGLPSKLIPTGNLRDSS